jgi:hypothetical protein
VVAAVDFALLGFILSEVKALLREHFAANRQLEILVGNQSIAVEIELPEDVIKLSLVDFHAPEIKIKPEFPFANLA